ncbi:FYVE, RhoGEF and PH domain-containing protein 2-like, partial [Diadema antillarum]|uniref:FYVE, RhoGEF and PH domain-containing protein 2-like n=1 Tax=Diadema antillarum TaxID=105358 RepID=UPI003A861975
ISKDSAEKWEDRCTLLDGAPTCKTSPNKSPLMEKFRQLSEGKGLKSRARKETGAPLAADKLGGSGRTNSGGALSNGNSMEKMDEGDDDDEDDDDDDDDDSSEDSRRNKPPVPRKPTHLANKVNGKQYLTNSDSTGLTDKTSPNVPSKPPLTAAKSAGAALEQRRVTDLSDDQRTYDQVCFEDPSSFLPAPKSKNLERFLGMSPAMAQPIKSIKPCEALSPTSTGGSGGAKGFMKFIRRKSDNGDEEDADGNAHYAVVDLHTSSGSSERTSQKKRDKKPKNSPANALSSSPGKTELKRVSSGADTSKLSGDSGISLMLDTSKRNSRGNSVPPGFKDPLDKTGSMDSDYVEGDSSDDDHYIVDSDFDHSEDEHVSKERPTENINFINQSHKVAYEVLTSERQFVDRLHLLHKVRKNLGETVASLLVSLGQKKPLKKNTRKKREGDTKPEQHCLLENVFEMKIRAENDKHNWFPKDVINVIFSNLSTIYEFHNKFLLPQLEDRMQEWEKNPCLGDILVRLSPFLKLYTDYVSNFDNAIKCLNTWTTKVPKFASLLQEIQKKDVCVSLTLQHHMLEPVQRIPRYELLLKAYLKKLPEESCDRADSEKALGLISKAAQHSNDMMQTMEHFEKLLKLNERIDGESIIDPSRRLLKEGKITRVSARSGELLDRYLFLFNDMLLCCTQKRQITGSVSYKVKDKVDIDEVRLLDGAATRFRLERSPKSLEFETNTDEQKEEWMAVLLEAIKEMVRKKDTFKTNSTTSEKEDDYAIPLGERVPVQIKDDEVTMCMRCGLEFTLTRRRHHCRACGAVVCGKCSGFTAPLPYDDNKPNRVCCRCNHILKGEDDPTEGSRKSFVDIDEHKSFCSYLWYLQPKGPSWVKYWVAATDQDLFALRAPKDVRAVLTLPIKLYQGNEVTEEDGIDKEYAFKVMSNKTTHYFAAENKETKYNWLLVLQSGVSSVISPLSNGQPESNSTSF